MKEILKLQNISLSVNEKKINHLNLIVKNGDFFVINGKNAAGKSLLLKLLYLKIFPQIGDIFLYGKKITQKNKVDILEFRKKTGVILQNDVLIPFFTVYQNIELASAIQNKKLDSKKRINEILDWLGLNQIKSTQVSKLSNGQKQRVVIARALINSPQLIIADQPENNLDKDTIRKIFYLLEYLNKIGTTIIITSNLENVLRIKYKTINLNNND